MCRIKDFRSYGKPLFSLSCSIYPSFSGAQSLPSFLALYCRSPLLFLRSPPVYAFIIFLLRSFHYLFIRIMHARIWMHCNRAAYHTKTSHESIILQIYKVFAAALFYLGVSLLFFGYYFFYFFWFYKNEWILDCYTVFMFKPLKPNLVTR